MTSNGAQLLREVGLSADGPVVLGRGAVRARGSGVYVIELPAPLPTAPIDIHALSGWLAKVPSLELDGGHPTSKQLLARLVSFWIPSATVLYIGSSERSIGGRVAALEQHVLGDPRPHAAAHWLKTLRVPGLRVWWASTDAPEEYEDALLEAFAASIPDDERSALRDPVTVLPFANLRTVTGQAKDHGLRRSTLASPAEPAPPQTKVVELPPGDAEGSRPEPKGTGTTRRTNRPATTRRTTTRPTAARSGPSPAPVILSADGLTRMKAELEQLTRVRRPEVIDRVRLARQLGDLRENSEYAAAREEQSFLEGRIQQLEAQLRTAVVAQVAADDGRVAVGHTVTVEVDGERRDLTIVGARESNPGAGRISYASPVGQALIGRAVGDEAIVRTPGGEVPYRIVAITTDQD